MDKSEKKSQDDQFKNSMMQGMANPAAFLDAASLLAYWGNGRDTSQSMPFMPFAGGMTGMGMGPSGSPGSPGFDKNASQQAQLAAASNLNSNWYAMAQLAAQDYLSRLQMSGMMHPEMANFQALAMQNAALMGGSQQPPTKSNLKRKDKSFNQNNLDNKLQNEPKKADTRQKSKKLQASSSSKASMYNNAFQNTPNFHKELLAMSAALNSEAELSKLKNKNTSQSLLLNKNISSPMNSSRTNKDNDRYDTSGNDAKSKHLPSNMKVSDFPSASAYLNNPSLLGVRLPPDTEIIKYTSGSKTSATNAHPDNDIHLSPKRKRMDSDYDPYNKTGNDRVEVIKLPASTNSNGAYNSKTNSERDWNYGTLNLSTRESTSATTSDVETDAPLNLSLKSSEDAKPPPASASSANNSSSEQYLSKSPSKSDNNYSVNNLNNLQNLTAGIGMLPGESKSQYKEGRPRNLGRGVSKPKKNTVASLLAQSRAVGIKPLLSAQQLLSSNADIEKVRQAILEANQQNSDVQSNTDSESYNDTSGLSESETESENANLNDLRLPLEDGWKRETIIRGLTKSGHIKGEVCYYSPYDSSAKLKTMNQVHQELKKYGSDFKTENFSFSARKLVGTFLQAAPPPYATDGEFVRMTDSEVSQRLEEIRLYTRQSMTQLNVEQRIEIARQQQALREAKKFAKEEITKSKDKVKQIKDTERCEKYEMQRKERETRTLQLQEAKRKKEEETQRQRMEEQRRKQEEKEQKKQMNLLQKEQEKERRKQHIAIIKQLEYRRKFEEREKKRHQMLLEKLIAREKKLAIKKMDSEILAELRKPKEDSEIPNKQEIPSIPRIGGLKLTGQGFADLLMAFEFLHNFGETLGFDMESLPTLQSLHNAISQENAIEAEDELLSVITHLLVCAIEDPGIPNPNRHTTLLGQTLRQADITHQNVSEILRIYLYSVATGEVRQQTGINFERERCGKFGDLHQNDSDERQSNIINSKNSQFYEVLHDNERYKLSESLKDKPYVALNSTVKAQILAMLCNDLLLNKAVCRQIEGGLESQAVLKKERFLIDNKVRKCKSLVNRKLRIEQYEKSQQLLKAEKEQELIQSETPSEAPSETLPESMDESKDASSILALPEKISETKLEPPQIDEDSSMTKTIDAEIKSTATDTPLPTDKIDDDNSDLESEEMEEDEDTCMTADEAQKKLEKLLEQSCHTKQQLQKSLNSLRAKHYGQDRFWRRYWYLPKCGGIYVEGCESAQSDIFKLQTKLDEKTVKVHNETENHAETKINHKRNSRKSGSIHSGDSFSDVDDISQAEEENVSTNPITINESQHHNTITNTQQTFSMPRNMTETRNPNENDNDFDIEDSIPTAILVQKENKSDDSKFVEINHVVPTNQNQSMEDENRKMNNSYDLTTDENGKIKSENFNVKTENGDGINPHNSDFLPKQEFDDGMITENGMSEAKPIKSEQLLSKWFSLIEQEIPLYTLDCPVFKNQLSLYQNIQCKDEIILQGHQWEIQNNLQFYNVLQEIKAEKPVQFKNESVLSTSGLNEKNVEKFLNDIKEEPIEKQDIICTPHEQTTEMKLDLLDQSHCFMLPPLANMSINNLSVFVQCENLNSIQMTPEEQEAVEEVKRNGINKSIENIFLPKELRYGWWKISEIEDMNEVIKSLHPKGVREKSLRQSLLSALSESIDLTVPCPVSNPRAPPPPHGYVEPEAFNAWNPRIAKRVEQQLLDQVEGLEDKIANASMQIKGWIVPQRDNDSESDILETIDINLIRDRILNLEAAIERRYLKPPLGNNTAEAQLLNATNSSDTINTSANNGNTSSSSESETVTKGLSSWRDAVQRSVTSAQLSMALYTLEQCVAWDKSIMKANCQFCQSGESEDKLLLCDGCDRGYHTYCFKPKMEKIPEGDWFCYECLNKATGERKCIVCGGFRAPPIGKLVYCELCPRAYHNDCYIPPMLKVPRGKWYCANCASKAPPKKRAPRKPKELKTHNSSQSLNSSHDEAAVAPASPAASMASFCLDEQSSILNSTVVNETSSPPSPIPTTFQSPAPVLNSNVSQQLDNNEAVSANEESDHSPVKSDNEMSNLHSQREKDEQKEKIKAERKAAKKLIKEMTICKIILEEMEVHEDSWPFLLPVNTKQFPTYKKVIKSPMDLSTIKKRLQEVTYKSRDEFVSDVRQIFDNCEVFNEDDSPVGKAGHGMRKYFELRWAELTDKNSNSS